MTSTARATGRAITCCALGAALIAAVAGCHKEDKATGHGTVSGEILPGSVSDAMLPYDQVKSQPPLAPPTAAVSSGNAASDEAAIEATTSDAGGADTAVSDSAASAASATPVPQE